jgi:hypothetical protein
MIARLEKRDYTNETIDVIHGISNGSEVLSFHDDRLDGFEFESLEMDDKGYAVAVYLEMPKPPTAQESNA